MSSIAENRQEVKRKPGPGDEDRATQGCDLSASPAPSGRGVPFVELSRQALASKPTVQGRIGQALPDINPDGDNAINPTNSQSLPEHCGEAASGVFSDSSPLVGLSHIYVNCHTIEITGVLQAFREHLYKLEHTPYTYLHLKHREEGYEALYRVNAMSSSRYFPGGRANIRKEIYQRLDGEQKQGVFFHLTVDAGKYSLTDAWPAMWPRFNRFKKSLNVYRKRNMNASRGILYLAALESHKSDYPHLHVYCPGLRWLVKKSDLTKMDHWWGMGSVKTEKERHEDSARGYVLKYISKLGGWSEVSLAMLWHFNIRLYNLSHNYYTGESRSEWELLARYEDAKALALGLGLELRQAEALIEAWATSGDNMIHLT